MSKKLLFIAFFMAIFSFGASAQWAVSRSYDSHSGPVKIMAGGYVFPIAKGQTLYFPFIQPTQIQVDGWGKPFSLTISGPQNRVPMDPMSIQKVTVYPYSTSSYTGYSFSVTNMVLTPMP